jgi:hypothetical protein
MYKIQFMDVLKIVLIAIAGLGAFFLLSRLQMKAWLLEAEKFLDDKLDQYKKNQE